MGVRLMGFDYTRPYYYMVTMKCRGGVAPLSKVVVPGRCEMTAVTRAFVNCIRNFHLGCQAIAPIECFTVMPDHIHLLIRLVGETTPRVGAQRLSSAHAYEERTPKVGAQRLSSEHAYEERTPKVGAQCLSSEHAYEERTPKAGAQRLSGTAGAAPDLALPKRCAPTLSVVSQGQALAPLRLEAIVEMLMQALEGRYREVTKRREAVFEANWHDWIVIKEGQLAAFTRYIRENPRRRWLRLSHPEYFRKVNEIEFLGRKWYGYGNAALLELPVITPFRCSRKWIAGGEEWRRAVVMAARLGPGGAGIGTFMSPCEKACGHALGLAGGCWIVLSPEGFGPRWHPSRKHEQFCAEGRMLFISLYPATAREPTNAELYERCHEMGDLVAAALGGGRAHA